MSDQTVLSKSFVWIGISLSLLVLSFMAIPFAYQAVQAKPAFHYTDTVVHCNASFPDPVGYVNDFARILTTEEVHVLDSIIDHHEKETTNEISIVTVDTAMLQGCSLFDYSLTLANKWGVGKKHKNNGVMIALCIQQQITIQNGYGIEKIFSNGATDSVIQNIIIPEFRKNDYFGGVEKGLLEIIKAISAK